MRQLNQYATLLGSLALTAAVLSALLVASDVVRLSTGIEFVFNQVGLRDKATPESKKLGPYVLRSTPGSILSARYAGSACVQLATTNPCKSETAASSSLGLKGLAMWSW